MQETYILQAYGSDGEEPPVNWQTIIDVARAKEASTVRQGVQDIPAGSLVRVILDFSWPSWLPLAQVANLGGVEWWVPRLAGIRDLQITDVHANSNTQIEIDGIAQGIDPAIIAGAVAGALGGAGIGTIVPGAGTLVGASIGFLVGAIGGFVYSYFMTRMQVQAEIVNAVTEQERIGAEFIEQQETVGGMTAEEALLSWQELVRGASGVVEQAQQAATPSVSLPAVAGISIGTIAVIGVGILLLSRKS